MKNIFHVYEIENHLIIFNDSNTLLIIINPLGEIVLSKNNILVLQFYGNYISVKENDVAGVYKYDGSIVLPFEFKSIFIFNDGFSVLKKDGVETFIPLKNDN